MSQSRCPRAGFVTIAALSTILYTVYSDTGMLLASATTSCDTLQSKYDVTTHEYVRKGLICWSCDLTGRAAHGQS